MIGKLRVGLLVTALSLGWFSAAQDLNVELFKNFVSIEHAQKGVGYEILPLENDTLIRQDRFYAKVQSKSIYKNDTVYREYLKLAFSDAALRKNINSSVPIVQWKQRVNVYLDDKLPSTLSRSFKRFVKKNFDNIANLEIQFTNHKDRAVIAFMNTSDSVYEIKPGTKSYERYLKDYPDGLPFDHIKSNQSSDYNGTRNSALVKINYGAIAKEEVALEKMVHMFYLLLTAFRLAADGAPSRLAAYGYSYQEIADPMDIALLQMHYHILWQTGPNYREFKKLTSTNDE